MCFLSRSNARRDGEGPQIDKRQVAGARCSRQLTGLAYVCVHTVLSTQHVVRTRRKVVNMMGTCRYAHDQLKRHQSYHSYSDFSRRCLRGIPVIAIGPGCQRIEMIDKTSQLSCATAEESTATIIGMNYHGWRAFTHFPAGCLVGCLIRQGPNIHRKHLREWCGLQPIVTPRGEGISHCVSLANQG